jgi:putative flavoprotein involved in K+ transport
MTDGHALYDVIIIGGGQAGLATAYYLRRAGLNFLILDAETQPGGAWLHTWESLRLFSPSSYSSLPGWQMPQANQEIFPGRDEVVDYLARYELRYDLPVIRPVLINRIEAEADCLVTYSKNGQFWRARSIVSATGTWHHPFVPEYTGLELFEGRQMHSAQYFSPKSYQGERVLVVGGGNSGAQLLAELSKVADTTWVTQRDPVFLPDEVDGRVLFARATARVKGVANGDAPIGGIGDIVMVPSVKEARERNVLGSVRPFMAFTRTGVIWPDGSEEAIDAVLWCTGFRPALSHLEVLGVVNMDGKVDVKQNQSVLEPRLWLIGYGDWSGLASATLIGASRTAREMTPALIAWLTENPTSYR